MGEVVSDFSPSDDVTISQLRDEKVPVRKVRWLNVVITRSEFPPRVGRRLINRHAITEIRDDLYEEIFNRVYPNYCWRNISKIDVFGDLYRGKDPLQPYVAARLIKYVLASAFAFEKGRIAEFNALSKIDPEDAIRQFYDESLVDELAQNFNSPGRFTVITRVGTLSLVAAAGILLATAPKNSSGFAAQTAEVSQVLESQLNGDQASRDDAKAVMDNYLSATEPSVWEPIQKKMGEPSREGLGLSLSNKVEQERKLTELDR